MTTINVSLPDKLKKQADAMIKDGYFASFSDLIRTAIRNIISADRYDRMAAQALDDYRKGKLTVLRNAKDIDEFVTDIEKRAQK